MSVRITPVRLQDVDKIQGTAKLFNEIFDNLREMEAKLTAEPATPKAKKGKKS